MVMVSQAVVIVMAYFADTDVVRYPHVSYRTEPTCVLGVQGLLAGMVYPVAEVLEAQSVTRVQQVLQVFK